MNLLQITDRVRRTEILLELVLDGAKPMSVMEIYQATLARKLCGGGVPSEREFYKLFDVKQTTERMVSDGRLAHAPGGWFKRQAPLCDVPAEYLPVSKPVAATPTGIVESKPAMTGAPVVVSLEGEVIPALVPDAPPAPIPAPAPPVGKKRK